MQWHGIISTRIILYPVQSITESFRNQMSRSSGRSKAKKPKYTQEAADFDKFIKNECFGDGSIREIKVKLQMPKKNQTNNPKNI